MEDECFNTFNVPTFRGFSEEEVFDENVDTYFDVTNQSELKQDTTSSRKKRISSYEAYYSPLLEFNSGPSTNNESDPLELFPEEPNRQPYNLRKSMSIGNLIMFSEEENRMEYHVEEICESVQNLYMSDSQEKSNKKSCIPIKSNLNKNNNQSLYWKGSQDHLNKLAQPKHYASVENLRHGNVEKFVSLAEAVNQFQNCTPVRFRSKPNLYQPPAQPLTRTVPESPMLQTKTRSRPAQRVLSHEEREEIEIKNLQKFKIKAHPVNKKALQGPLKPMAPVDRKKYTIPKPFNFSAVPTRKVLPDTQKFVFHAKPMPKSAEKPGRTQDIRRREATKPVTPSFMKNYKPPIHKMEVPPQTKVATHDTHDKQPLTVTIPKPFSFEQRNLMVQKKREQFIEKIMEEERRAREFHAKPIPKSIYKKCNSVQSESYSSQNSNKKHYFSLDNISSHFKARPPLVLSKEPFVPAKADKPLTQVKPFQLCSELRSCEREEFEREKRRKAEHLEYIKNVQEVEILRQEQEEIARIRKETEYKAKPIKKYKQVIIQPSGKITVPCSPKFQSNILRQTKNKENIADNSNTSYNF